MNYRPYLLHANSSHIVHNLCSGNFIHTSMNSAEKLELRWSLHKKAPQNERISMQVVKYSHFCCCYDIIWVSRSCMKYSNSATFNIRHSTFDIWKIIHCLHIDVTCNISYVWEISYCFKGLPKKVNSHQSERVRIDDFILRGCVQCIKYLHTM